MNDSGIMMLLVRSAGPDGADPAAGPRRMGRLLAASLLVLCLLTGALALCCAPASALTQRGHVFASSFGEEGALPGQFEEPTGVAVDESSGDVYVVDAKNERVEIFRASGSGGYEYLSQFKVHSPGAIAVDNSTGGSDPSRGDVYVAGSLEKEAPAEERDFVYEYSPSEAKVIHKWRTFKAKEGEELAELELEDIAGVAVDSGGALWVYWGSEGVIDAFSKQPTKAEGSKLVWEPSLRRTPEVESRFGCFARASFAVAPAHESFYVGYERESSNETCPGESEEAPDPFAIAKLDSSAPTPRTVTREIDHQNTTAVAVDATSGDVYLDNVTSVAAFTPSGSLIQRFGSEQLSGGSGVAVDGSSGQVLLAESAKDMVAVFAPEEAPQAPVVDGVSAQSLTPSSTELRAQIDPRGAETEYQFQYGTVDCASAPSSCTSVPVPGAKIKAGFGDQSVSVEVAGLQPATAYYYRVLATNARGGPVQGAPSPNTFQTLPSPSVLPDGRAWELVTPAEKHGAAVEAIPPHAKDGIIQAAADGAEIAWLAAGPVVGEPVGNRSFESTQLISTRGAGGWETQSLETPHDKGRGLVLPLPTEYHYFSPDLSQSLVEPTEPVEPSTSGVFEDPPLSPEASEKTFYVRQDPPAPAQFAPLVSAANDSANTKFGGKIEFLDATPDLKHVIFESKVGLSAAAPTAAGLYEWEAGKPLELISVLPDGSPAPDEPGREPSLGGPGGVNARHALSSDGTRVFWTSASEEQLYLRDTQRGETIALDAAQGHGSTEPGPGGHEVPEPTEGHQEVHFQSASADGSKVFFTDTARLSEDSAQEPVGEEAPADLYEFEVTSVPGEPLRGRLSDLTAGSPTASADVLNVIPGASEDGANVYFVANGVLAPGATPGECVRKALGEAPPPQPGATCNLYLSEPVPGHSGERQTRFLAALSFEDAADWGAGHTSSSELTQGNLSGVTSSVSPDGGYLAFMSLQSLTGYDNRNADGGQSAEELYLYDAHDSRLICASCDPGEEGHGFKAPQALLDTQTVGEGNGLLVDRPETWSGHWLAGSIPGWTSDIGGDQGGQPHALYQPRYLTNSGRLFFDSPDALVPGDENGKEDVYEYEPQGVGSCRYSGGCLGLISSGTSSRESAFLDASENGDDVFFLTAAQLLPADTDNAFDIYDAHVCSESSPCPASRPSSGEECTSSATCRPQAPAPSQVAVAPGTTLSGPGNIAKQGSLPSKTAVKPKPPTRAQELAGALRTCRKLKSRHRRTACEAQARKRYGAKSKSKSKGKSKGKPKAKKTASRSNGGRSA